MGPLDPGGFNREAPDVRLLHYVEVLETETYILILSHPFAAAGW